MTKPWARHLDVYFYFSHVRTSIPNQWVHRFHQALDLGVESRAAPTAGLRRGSIYHETSAIARERDESGELPEFRVIVPLYTREYLHDPPPEYLRFLDSRRNGGRRPQIHPVFWDANPGGRDAPGLAQARSLGVGIGDYEECGLAAMCRLNAFARDYQQIIDRLAGRIVAAAEHPERTPAWAMGDVTPTTTPSAEAQFIISVIAPRGRQWNPFGDKPGAAPAEHAAVVARGLVLLPEIVEYDAAVADIHDSPGVLLIDLWALDSETLRPTAQQALRCPPPWVTVVAVVSRRGAEHEARRLALIRMASELTGHPVTPVSDRSEFEHMIEDVVQRTRRGFLRGQPVNPPRDM